MLIILNQINIFIFLDSNIIWRDFNVFTICRIQVEDKSIEATPQTLTNGAKNYVSGVAKVGDNLILLLNLESLVEASSDLLPQKAAN